MIKKILLALSLTLGVLTVGGTAQATKPDSEGVHKVWVCHATSGQGELKNGYNLIEVDVASTQYEGHLQHATDKPKVNKEFGDSPDFLLFDYIDVDPYDLPGKCGPPPPPTTTTTTTVPEEETTTTTVVVTTTTTVPEEETTTTTVPEEETTTTTVAVTTTTVAGTTTTVEVDIPPTIPPSSSVAGDTGELPHTGAGTTWAMTAIAAMLVLSGAALLRIRRRPAI